MERRGRLSFLAGVTYLVRMRCHSLKGAALFSLPRSKPIVDDVGGLLEA